MKRRRPPNAVPLGPISPLDLPRDTSEILVFGGSFDPPHSYHVVGPLVAVTRVLGPKATIVYVPTAGNPLKPDGPVAADGHRLAMLRLALDVPGRRAIWTDELDRAARLRRRALHRPSYTVESLRRLRRAVRVAIGRDAPIRLLIGADQAVDFHRWRDPRAILRMATPLVLPRDPVTTPDALYSRLSDTGAWSRPEIVAWCSWIAPTFPMPAASTDIRKALARAPRDAEAWEDDHVLSMINTPVAEYILAHGLYKRRSKTRSSH